MTQRNTLAMQDNTILYFCNLSYNGYQDSFLDTIDTTQPGSKFMMNLAKRFRPTRFVTRNGEWSLPWNQDLIPKYAMPKYDPSFKLSFAEVTDLEAIKIKNRISQGEQFAVTYSGGIDSTVIVAALIKNLSLKELESVYVYASVNSIIEHPVFWEQFIFNKFKVIDSNRYKMHDLIDMGLTPIIADEGDAIFGTMIGISLYNNYDVLSEGLSAGVKENLKQIRNKISSNEVHYSRYKDLIIKHLSLPNNTEFGRLLYEKYDHNIKTASVPVHSLHDFFWWLIFNVKYLNCSVRAALYFNDRIDFKQAVYKIENWYNAENYQLWSMVNNNNGSKIGSTVISYKTIARDYIYELDKNDWYRKYKLKLESLNFIVGRQNVSNIEINKRPTARIALTDQYDMLYVDDFRVQTFLKNKIENYSIDWTQ